MHQVKGANPFALTIFLSLWCSPVNMPASHAGDHRSEAGQGRQFHRRVVHGEKQTHQNQAALDVQVRLAPTIFKAPKALSAMHSPGTRVLARCNSGWGLHFVGGVPRWPCASIAIGPALKPVS
jgi:hypothetical protein